MKRFPPARVDGWEHLRDADSVLGLASPARRYVN